MAIGDLNFDVVSIPVGGDPVAPVSGLIKNYVLANFPAGSVSVHLLSVELVKNNKSIIKILVISRQEA